MEIDGRAVARQTAVSLTASTFMAIENGHAIRHADAVDAGIPSVCAAAFSGAKVRPALRRG